MDRPQRGSRIKVSRDDEHLAGDVIAVMEVPPAPWSDSQNETELHVELDTGDQCVYMVNLAEEGVTWEVVTPDGKIK